jgi:hypothetical protein
MSEPGEESKVGAEDGMDEIPAGPRVWEAAERLLSGLEGRRLLPPSALAELAAAVRERVAARQRTPGRGGTDAEPFERQYAVWQAIFHYLQAMPYRDRQRLKRSEQWREVLPRVRDLGEQELIDWVVLQAEVAHNRERGIPDMRQRKDGPTFCVMLEHVANRQRKALAIVKWLRAADAEGCWIIDSAFHAETKRILMKYGIREFDDTGAVVPTDEPLARTS